MKTLRTAVLVGSVLAMGAVWAQEAPPIVIANRIVARIRDKGAEGDVDKRAAKIDQRIADVISYEDTQHPQVSVKQVGGLWHVVVGKRDVMAVYPGDAKPQKIDPKALAALWAKNMKAALPFATPCSKLPPPPGGVKKPTGAVKPPLGAVVAPKPSGVTPAGTGPSTAGPQVEVVTQTPGASTTPTGETVPTPQATTQPPQPRSTPRSAALLLLLDSFNNVRLLNEGEYLAGRDRLASNVLENLEPYMQQVRTQGTAAGGPEPVRPTTITIGPDIPTAPTIKPTKKPPVKPVTTAVKPTGPTVPSIPTVPTTSTKPSVTPTTKPLAPTSVNSPKIPQKQRIGRKFAAAAGPFDQLKQSGGANSDQVGELLKTARAAFAAGDFETSETDVDQALQLMGVPIPK